jgi:hypothetical protein
LDGLGRRGGMVDWLLRGEDHTLPTKTPEPRILRDNRRPDMDRQTGLLFTPVPVRVTVIVTVTVATSVSK